MYVTLASMQILAGTSGFSYSEWCGRFYPEALPGAQMLHFYASRLPSVEINNTFYRMPNQEMVAGWRDDVPESFCFAVKATRRITHQKKLADVGADIAQLFGVIDVLGGKLGPVLFQLPPFLKKDLGLLQAFLAELPSGRRAAVEFRHPSWFADDVYGALSERNVALVAGDLEDAEKSPPFVATADFGYLRLRRLDYAPSDIADWGARLTQQTFQAAYVYFKHEVLGPMFAEALLANLSGQEMADLTSIRASIAAPPQKPSKAPAARAAKPSSKAPASRGAKPSSKPAASRGAKPSSKPPASRGAKSKTPTPAPAQREARSPSKASKP